MQSLYPLVGDSFSFAMDNPAKPTSIWQIKPWWCQPWSILLTGNALIGGSWLLLHRWWLTLIVAIPVALWMGVLYFALPPSGEGSRSIWDQSFGENLRPP